jgi:uncharacterized protein (TIGR03790 family)
MLARIRPLLLLALFARAALGADADRVLLVRNSRSPIACAIADDYARRRGVTNVLTIDCQDSALSSGAENMKYADYLAQIEQPLRACLAAKPAIDFIVLTKGIPIRLTDCPDLRGGKGRFSLDSHLAALDYDKLPGAVGILLTDHNWSGTAWANRYWNADKPFSHAAFGGYLVTRLDGYTEADAKALTTRALAAEQSPPPADGVILLDACPNFGYADKAKQPYQIPLTQTPEKGLLHLVDELDWKDYNADLEVCADRLKARGLPVDLETAKAFVGDRVNLRGYSSWGSNDARYKAAAYHSLAFAPGAVGDTAVSTSARTFLPTHGGQSLIADLIAQGITGVKGYTDEPLLQAIASPTILFDRYTRGWTLAESLYAASRFVGWQDVVIGDPICRGWGGGGK